MQPRAVLRGPVNTGVQPSTLPLPDRNAACLHGPAGPGGALAMPAAGLHNRQPTSPVPHLSPEKTTCSDT